MTKTAQEYPAEAMALRPSWQRDRLAKGRSHREGQDALEFLADLADRIATACVSSQCAASAHAVPLPGQASTQSDYCQLPQQAAPLPCDGLQTDSSAVDLLTADGHMRPLDQIQADIIRLAISHYNGRISEVARRLRMGRSTLYRKLEEYGIEYKF